MRRVAGGRPRKEPVNPLNNPWLIAAWPDPGFAGTDAIRYLARHLGAVSLRTLDLRAFVEPRGAHSTSGLFHNPAATPLLAWRDPYGRQDLLLLCCDEVPTRRRWDYCEEIASVAHEFGVKRAVTLAGAPAAVDPEEAPAVRGVATSTELLSELSRFEIQPLAEGIVPGLPGLLPPVLASQGVEAACLLVDVPFFATEMQNPAAAQALLDRLASLAGLDLDLSPLAEAAKQTVHRLAVLQDRFARSMAVQISLRMDEVEEEAMREAEDEREEDQERFAGDADEELRGEGHPEASEPAPSLSTEACA